MYLGKIVEIGKKEEIFSDPLHPYTISLLSAIPIPNPREKRKRIKLKGEVPSPISPPPGCKFHPRCPYKGDQCSRKEPQLIEVKRDHYAACHRT